MAKVAGSVWIEGNTFRYIDSSNREWYFEGTLVGAPVGQPYKDTVLADGVSNLWRLDEASGVSLIDTKAGNTATLPGTGGISYRAGSALVDGTWGLTLGAGMTAGATTLAAGIATGTTCSFEVWLNLTDVQNVGLYGCLMLSAGYDGLWVKKIDASTYSIDVEYSGYSHYNTTPLQFGTLYHVVVSVTAGATTFIINGVADGTATGWASVTLGTMFHGTWGMTGLVDELAFYVGTALSVSQAATHYAARNYLAIPGSCWIEGNDLHYINEVGNQEYKVYGADQGARTGALSGSLWIESTLLAWIKQGATNKYLGHDDQAYVDVHSDVAHVDVAHGDVTHVDSHTDTHADTAHTDTHADITHADHTDSWHDDANYAHGDSHTDTHTDTAHGDVAHDDYHNDIPYIDWHTDEWFEESYGDVEEHIAHRDEHGDSHTDTSYVDTHSDVAHVDWTNYHEDAHGDVAHGDTSHTDTHGDVTHIDTHGDVAHGDVTHVDGAHTDHTDSSHTDTAHVDKPVLVGA